MNTLFLQSGLVSIYPLTWFSDVLYPADLRDMLFTQNSPGVRLLLGSLHRSRQPATGIKQPWQQNREKCVGAQGSCQCQTKILHKLASLPLEIAAPARLSRTGRPNLGSIFVNLAPFHNPRQLCTLGSYLSAQAGAELQDMG